MLKSTKLRFYWNVLYNLCRLDKHKREKLKTLYGEQEIDKKIEERRRNCEKTP